ncbi:MAG: hypothetical protein ACXVFO_12935, partial [Solirubrobacteraceae bacterium]
WATGAPPRHPRPTKDTVMADRAIDVYLNDHLTGAMLGTDLAGQLQAQNEGTALGELMQSLAPQIDQDRQTLIELMRKLGTSKNPVKQATGWIAEKASRAKFTGMTSGEPELGTFMALETLVLGVRGKACMWTALRQVADQHPAIASMDLDELIERARTQEDALERERRAAGRHALSHQVHATA